MIDRCDRCGGRGSTKWSKGTEPLVLCPKHTTKHEHALIADGFEVFVIDDPAMVDPKDLVEEPVSA